MKIAYRIKDRLIQAFIVGMLLIIVLAYYKIEFSDYPYVNYKMAATLFKRHDAELNESLVLNRVGLLKQYDTLVASLEGLYSTLGLLKTDLDKTPNLEISKELAKLQGMLKELDKMVDEFKRLNPILINATNDFSKILSDIIESETQADVVERFSIQNYNPDHYEYLNKLNSLFKDMLIYTGGTNNDQLFNSLNVLVNQIKNDPIKVKNIDLALRYAETILQSKTKITDLEMRILSFPLLKQLDRLTQFYDKSYDRYLSTINIYQYLFYLLAISLLVIVHFAFKRLQNIVHELDETNQQLEQRVLQRTQDLADKNADLNKAMIDLHEAQDQLIVQEKMASVGMLTTGIAHEIKNPLNFINNFSELSNALSGDLKSLLESSKKDIPEETYTELYDISSDLESNCKKIQEYGTRADNIVNSMLQHSKQSSAQKENTKIRPLIENAAEVALHDYKAQNPNFEAELQTHFDPELINLFVAPAALSQVFVFILNNACWALSEKAKSEPNFKPLISINTKQAEKTAIITILDNGIGIPEKNLMKIFEPFFTTRPTGFGNTGLGLSICYDIITKQHKGTFSVNSIEGKQTEFTITLPIIHQDAI